MSAGEPLASSRRPTGVRWLIFILACATSWLLYLHRYSWGIVKPYFRREFPEFTDIEVGWLDSAFLATYGFGQIPGGMAGDLLGPRAVLSVLPIVWSLATIGVAWTSGFWALIGARAAFGLAQAGVYPILSKITRVWFPLATRTSVQGIVTAMGRIGGACAPILIATMLMGWLHLSWQMALLVMTVPGIFLAIAVWVIVRNRPAEHPWTNAVERELIEDTPSMGHVANVPETSPTERRSLHLTFASLFSLFMMLVYIFVSTFQDQFYVYWLPSFLKDGKGFSDELMGVFAPLPLLGGAAGGIFGGFLNDYLIRRTGNRRWARSGVAFTGKLIGACMVLLSLQFADGRMTMAILVAARVFSDWSLPTQWAAVTDMGGRAAATVFGIVNTAGAIGGFVAGPIFGYLKQEYGYDGLFYGVAVMCALAAVTWLFIDCTKKVVED